MSDLTERLIRLRDEIAPRYHPDRDVLAEAVNELERLERENKNLHAIREANHLDCAPRLASAEAQLSEAVEWIDKLTRGIEHHEGQPMRSVGTQLHREARSFLSTLGGTDG